MRVSVYPCLLGFDCCENCFTFSRLTILTGETGRLIAYNYRTVQSNCLLSVMSQENCGYDGVDT